MTRARTARVSSRCCRAAGRRASTAGAPGTARSRGSP
jgi:hypothetical protein